LLDVSFSAAGHRTCARAGTPQTSDSLAQMRVASRWLVE
jgi:hypothetical protein